MVITATLDLYKIFFFYLMYFLTFSIFILLLLHKTLHKNILFFKV